MAAEARKMSRSKTISELVETGEKFNHRRTLAYERPDRARDKLDAYAHIFLKVLKGRNLPAGDIDGLSDPYVDILINDVKKDQTETIWKTLDPVWDSNREFEIPIKSPLTVLMLRVMDADWGSDDDVLGFVEIPLSDLEHRRRIAGWFCLCPKEELEGTATTRLKTLTEARSEDHGAILVELELRIVSDDLSDEIYAWCIPAPIPKRYPEGGIFLKQDMDMQKVMDCIDDIQTTLMQGLIAPFRGFISYVLMWKDFNLSFIMFIFTLGISVYPHFYLTGIFLMWGTVLFLLRNPLLREAIVANPSTVPLSEKGFKLVAAMQNTDQTTVFLKRVIKSLRGKILDEDDVRTYAAFATLQGKPMRRYDDLVKDLKELGTRGKMVSFLEKPLDPKTLVKWEKNTGEIGENSGEDSNGFFAYKVKASKDDAVLDKHASELDLRTDLRWLGNPAVLALIPDSVEHSVMNLLPTFESVRNGLQSAATFFEDLFGWKSSTSPKVCIGLIVLGLVFTILGAWIEKVIFVIVTIYVFSSSTLRWTAFFNQRRASKLASSHKKENGKSWGFFKNVNSSAPKPRSKSTFQEVTSSCSSMSFRTLSWCGFGKKSD